jgi:RNA polymerase sigma factor (TIGR02999 family)
MDPHSEAGDSLSGDAEFGEIQDLLNQDDTANPAVMERLAVLFLPELKRIAEAQMRRERPDHTLQATALVSEFFVKLARHPGFAWKNRTHFLMAASKAMRQLLIDYARSHNAQKHGGKLNKLQVDDVDPAQADRAFEILEIDDLLRELAAEDPRMAKVVELKVFGGLTNAETGEVLNVHERTVKRDWQVARAWLFGRLRKGSGNERGRVGAN